MEWTLGDILVWSAAGVGAVLGIASIVYFLRRVNAYDASLVDREREEKFERQAMLELGIASATPPARTAPPAGRERLAGVLQQPQAMPADETPTPTPASSADRFGAPPPKYDAPPASRQPPGAAQPDPMTEALKRLAQFRPDVQDRGSSVLGVELRGRMITWHSDRTRCLVLDALPSPEQLAQALRRYDLVCVAVPGEEPLVVQRLRDYALSGGEADAH